MAAEPCKATWRLRISAGMGRHRAQSGLYCCLKPSRFTETQDPMAPTACKHAACASSTREQGNSCSCGLPALQLQESQFASGKGYFFHIFLSSVKALRHRQEVSKPLPCRKTANTKNRWMCQHEMAERDVTETIF